MITFDGVSKLWVLRRDGGLDMAGFKTELEAIDHLVRTALTHARASKAQIDECVRVALTHCDEFEGQYIADLDDDALARYAEQGKQAEVDRLIGVCTGLDGKPIRSTRSGWINAPITNPWLCQNCAAALAEETACHRCGARHTP